MPLQIQYLNHSGFVVDTGKHILIFDYFDPVEVERVYGNLPVVSETLATTDHKAGDLTQFPPYFAERKVVVFCSHAHADHYSPAIFSWKRQHPEISYVLSDDITPPAEGVRALMVSPEQIYQHEGMTIKTLRSTDAGVAFAVDVDGYRIYHGGDLHWWHWEGNDPASLQQMRERYCTQIDRLRTPGEPGFDVAFLPLDPRLGEAYADGLLYFLKILSVKWVVPMHFWGDFDVILRLLADERMAPYRERVVTLTHAGQTVVNLGGAAPQSPRNPFEKGLI